MGWPTLFENAYASQICTVLGFDPRDTCVYQPHWNDDNVGHFTFANRQDHSNIIIQFDPSEMDPPWLP